MSFARCKPTIHDLDASFDTELDKSHMSSYKAWMDLDRSFPGILIAKNPCSSSCIEDRELINIGEKGVLVGQMDSRPKGLIECQRNQPT